MEKFIKATLANDATTSGYINASHIVALARRPDGRTLVVLTTGDRYLVGIDCDILARQLNGAA